MMNKIEASRFAVLLVGMLLLAFTFINAYMFLKQNLSIISSSGLVDLFGEALAPLVEACIRVMYLGIMGWIGSIVTIRGVQLLTQPKLEAKPETLLATKPEVKRAKSPRRSSAKKKGKKG